MDVITRDVVFGDLTVKVKELRVSEIRVWLNEPSIPVEDREFDLISDLMSFDGIGIEEIHRFTNLEKKDVENLTPSAISKIVAVIKELNSVFFSQYVPALNQLRKNLDDATVRASNVASAV